MEEALRKPFHGVWNIIRFNWHFYVMAIVFLAIILITKIFITSTYAFLIEVFVLLTLGSLLFSLLISWYIYDKSGLYSFNWLEAHLIKSNGTLLNIHAGFDETSHILKDKFKEAKLIVFDFYNPALHTEISIKRARKVYPPFEGTQSVSSTNLPLDDKSVSNVFLILAAHEIRNLQERLCFFEEIKRVLEDSGNIIIVEHLRDWPNFLAYTVGFFHFYPKKVWLHTFKQVGLHIQSISTHTPFIHIFIIGKNGTSS